MIPPDSVRPGVYAITPDAWSAARILDRAQMLLSSGVRLMQLRSKHLDTPQREALARELLPLCAAHSVPLLINDDPRLAARIGAAGVHLGRDDCSYEEARAVLGAEGWIGVSCYADAARAERLAALGASYVAFGSVFPTRSKSTPHRASLQLFRDWRGSAPSVGIGGIDAANASEVARAGARWLAVISALWDTEYPEQVVHQINACYPPMETPSR